MKNLGSAEQAWGPFGGGTVGFWGGCTVKGGTHMVESGAN